MLSICTTQQDTNGDVQNVLEEKWMDPGGVVLERKKVIVVDGRLPGRVLLSLAKTQASLN